MHRAADGCAATAILSLSRLDRPMLSIVYATTSEMRTVTSASTRGRLLSYQVLAGSCRPQFSVL